MAKCKTTGKVYDRAAEYLKNRGFDISTLKVATLWRGPEHLLILDDDVIGEYCHISQKFVIYSDLISHKNTPEA